MGRNRDAGAVPVRLSPDRARALARRYRLRGVRAGAVPAFPPDLAVLEMSRRTAEGFEVQDCRSCGRPIIWASTVTGRSMPVDVDLSPGGTVELIATGHGVYASVVKVSDTAEPMRRTSHFATCPQADSWRQRRTGERR